MVEILHHLMYAIPWAIQSSALDLLPPLSSALPLASVAAGQEGWWRVGRKIEIHRVESVRACLSGASTLAACKSGPECWAGKYFPHGLRLSSEDGCEHYSTVVSIFFSINPIL